MFQYIRWLLPKFLKQKLTRNSVLTGLLVTIAASLQETKMALLTSRLRRFIAQTQTKSDYYRTEDGDDLAFHGLDRGLEKQPEETVADFRKRLLRDPDFRPALGTHQGLKHYLEQRIPAIRVDFIYEIAADDQKWLVFSERDLSSEATFNHSVLNSATSLDEPAFQEFRGTRIYSGLDTEPAEFIFWVKVYNPLSEEGKYRVYPEKILKEIDRLKPAHTRGYLVFNLLDPEWIFPQDGQVFIGTAIDIIGRIRQPIATA